MLRHLKMCVHTCNLRGNTVYLYFYLWEDARRMMTSANGIMDYVVGWLEKVNRRPGSFFFFFHTSHVLVFVSTPDPSRPPQADSWPFLVSVITCGQGHCVLCGSIRRSAVCRLFSILNSFIRFFLSELKNIYFQWWRPLWRHNSYVSISTPRDIGLQKW